MLGTGLKVCVGGMVVCKPILVFIFVQAEQLYSPKSPKLKLYCPKHYQSIVASVSRYNYKHSPPLGTLWLGELGAEDQTGGNDESA